MSFLSKLSELKKTSPTQHSRPINNNKTNDDKISSLLPKNYIRDEDPAVSRLKELRRQERIKNQKYIEKKKPTRTSTTKRVSKKRNNDNEKDVGTVYKRRIGSSGQQMKNNVTNIRREPIKKMSFEELMKQADSQTKLPIKEKSTTSNKSIQSSIRETKIASTRLNKPGFRKRDTSKIQRNPNHSNESVSREKTPEMIRINTRVSTGLAQPHKRFQAKLDNNRKPSRYAEEEYDEDLDDFIEDDEEEEEEDSYSSRHRRKSSNNNHHDRGYDRDEIWALFNRRGRGSNVAIPQDDWDSDDMETNEIDIMAEEEEATKAARLEDKREQAWLRKHDEAKAKMRQKSRN